MPSGHVIIIIPSIVYTKNGLLEDGIEKKTMKLQSNNHLIEDEFYLNLIILLDLNSYEIIHS